MVCKRSEIMMILLLCQGIFHGKRIYNGTLKYYGTLKLYNFFIKFISKGRHVEQNVSTFRPSLLVGM